MSVRERERGRERVRQREYRATASLAPVAHSVKVMVKFSSLDTESSTEPSGEKASAAISFTALTLSRAFCIMVELSQTHTGGELFSVVQACPLAIVRPSGAIASAACNTHTQ